MAERYPSPSAQDDTREGVMGSGGAYGLERVAEELSLCEAWGVKHYSADLRERLLGAIDAGLPQVEAARLFGVSVSSLKRWRQQVRQTGSLGARPRTGRRRRVRPEQEATLLAQVAAAPDATLAEHCATWAAATGVRLSTATMSRTLTRLDQPRKKSR